MVRGVVRWLLRVELRRLERSIRVHPFDLRLSRQLDGVHLALEALQA
jgi:hypothetical protein